MAVLVVSLSGCVSISSEDRDRFDAMTVEIRKLNASLDDYKARLDRLNEALERLQFTMNLLRPSGPSR